MVTLGAAWVWAAPVCVWSVWEAFEPLGAVWVVADAEATIVVVTLLVAPVEDVVPVTVLTVVFVPPRR